MTTICESTAQAVADIKDGSTVLTSGFGMAGMPVQLIGAHLADRMGNVVYRKTARNFGPVMATAATTAIVQVNRIVETGELDPEAIVSPSSFIDYVVEVGDSHGSV
jgi:acyl CoA:acetate/3-ketoacid CoA transferase alpha subunit